ncbi:hypothetical protein J6590_047816, partial [Homalodisca vitripennis]
YQSRCQSPTRPARAMEASIYLGPTFTALSKAHYLVSRTFLKPVVAYKTLTGECHRPVICDVSRYGRSAYFYTQPFLFRQVPEPVPVPHPSS